MSVHVGAYPSYGAPDSSLAAPVVEGLAASGRVRGLEVPWIDGRVALPAAGLPGEWCHVVTMIGATMAALGSDPAYGLASPDAAGRQAAVDDLRAVRDSVARRGDVLAVELHSAPTRTCSAAVFEDTLTEVASWDWAGVELVVEHCDAWTTGHPVEKGFLTVADELAAVAAVQGGPARVTAGVNWARSVIETRDPATGADHVRLAATRGLLGGLIFSSVADRTTALGGPLRDVHVAPAGTPGAPEGSLLTPAAIAGTVSAAGPYEGVLGLKLNLGPGLAAATIVERLLAVASLVEP